MKARRFFACAILVVFSLFTVALSQHITMAWDANTESNLAGYRVYRSTTSGSGFQRIAEVPCGPGVTTCARYTDNAISYDVTYYYVVTAFNTSAMESGYSNQISSVVPTPVTAPSAPTGLQVVESGAQVTARWTPAQDIQYHGVFYRAPGRTSFELLEVVDTNTWSARMPPGQRRGGELGIASLNNAGFSGLVTHLFR